MASKRFKIAIVDDHIPTVTTISNALEIAGFETIWAYTGEEGIALCKKEKPDLLVSDIKIDGGITGFEVIKSLSGQKVLFMTFDEGEAEKARKIRGSIGCLIKPVDNIELVNVVKKYFGIK